MKNKIVIGLGFMLSLAAGVSFADSIGDSNSLEINKDTPFQISLANKLDMSGGRYYTITCVLNNAHNSSSLRAQVELANGSLSPVTMNGQPAYRVGAKRFEAPLTNGMNTLVIDNVLPGSITKTKYSTPKYTPVTSEIETCSRWWHFSWGCKKSNKTTDMVKVPASDRQVILTTYDDTLTFSAKDDEASHKGTGTGYQILSCDAAVKADTVTTTDAPAPVADAPAPVSDIPSTPVADAPAPVADAPAAS